jgi:DNA polymerase III subunit chi
MPEVGFYHLTRSPLKLALPQLLQRVVAKGHKVLIRAADDARVAEVDDWLWTFDADSFLPHGTDRNDFKALQPILITTGQDRANAADVLVLLDGADAADAADYDRTLFMFDGGVDAEVGRARAHWKALKAAGVPLTYWQQGEKGWEKKAEG